MVILDGHGGFLQMLQACVGNKVATPAMAQLVSDDVDILAVSADDGGSSKCVNGVLHACSRVSDDLGASYRYTYLRKGSWEEG